MAHPEQNQPPHEDDEDWDAIDAEYAAFLHDAYGGRVPTLEELARDVRLLQHERQQRPTDN